MRTRVAASLAALLGILTVQPAAADPVQVIFSRVVIAGGLVNTTLNSQEGIVVDEDVARDADLLAAMASAVNGQNTGTGHASLASSLTSDNRFLSGAGVAAATAVSTVGQSQSHASVGILLRFLIDEPYQYSFNGLFSPASGSWAASLRPAPFDTDVHYFFEFSSVAPGTPLETGWLQPGLYDFNLRAQTSTFFRGVGSDTGLSPFAFSFRLTPGSDPAVTPEPATLVLLGSGMAIAAWRRRAAR